MGLSDRLIMVLKDKFTKSPARAETFAAIQSELERTKKTILTLERMLKDTEERTIALERGFEAAIRAVEIKRTDGEWYADTD